MQVVLVPFLMPAPCASTSPGSSASMFPGPSPGVMTPLPAASNQQPDKSASKQRWLLFLSHCARCNMEEHQCSLGTHCALGKQLWSHLLFCQDPRCEFPRCQTSKDILQHYRACTDLHCSVCNVLREEPDNCMLHLPMFQRMAARGHSQPQIPLFKPQLQPLSQPSSQHHLLQTAQANARLQPVPCEDAMADAQRKQRWLLFLRHCAKCRQDELSCPLGTRCHFGKQLWTHVLSCMDPNCDFPRCCYVRDLLKHHQGCKDAQCQVCVGVHAYVNSHRDPQVCTNTPACTSACGCCQSVPCSTQGTPDDSPSGSGDSGGMEPHTRGVEYTIISDDETSDDEE